MMKFTKKFLWKLSLLAGIFLLFFLLLDFAFRPTIEAYSGSKAKNIATSVINQSVTEVLIEQNHKYHDFIQTKINDQGEVSAIETNTFSVNIMKALIVDKITNGLRELESSEIKIPIGTLTGSHFFSGRGPAIHFSVTPIGNVHAELKHDFTSVGINQTRHQLMLQVKVSIRAILPGHISKVDVNTNFLIAETVVIGKVPDAYTDIQDAESGILSKINDYGAN